MRYANLNNKVVKVLAKGTSLAVIQYLTGDKIIVRMTLLTKASPKQILEAKLRGL